MSEQTIFEKILSNSIPGFIAFETELSAVIISLEGHPLVISKQPYRDIYELPADVAVDIMVTAARVARALKASTECEGVNLIQSNGAIAGQDVFHFHVHVKPRYENDDVTLTWDTSTKSDTTRSKLCEDITSHLASS